MEAAYGYVTTHKKYDDTKTYAYAKLLVEQGYPGAQELFNEIFKLRVKIILSDSDGYPSTSDTYISKYSKVYCDIYLQGEPGKKAKIYTIYTWPGGTPRRWDDTEYCSVGDGVSYYTWLTEPSRGVRGTFTIKVYDSATGSLLGDDSVQII